MGRPHVRQYVPGCKRPKKVQCEAGVSHRVWARCLTCPPPAAPAPPAHRPPACSACWRAGGPACSSEGEGGGTVGTRALRGGGPRAQARAAACGRDAPAGVRGSAPVGAKMCRQRVNHHVHLARRHLRAASKRSVACEGWGGGGSGSSSAGAPGHWGAAAAQQQRDAPAAQARSAAAACEQRRTLRTEPPRAYLETQPGIVAFSSLTTWGEGTVGCRGGGRLRAWARGPARGPGREARGRGGPRALASWGLSLSLHGPRPHPPQRLCCSCCPAGTAPRPTWMRAGSAGSAKAA